MVVYAENERQYNLGKLGTIESDFPLPCVCQNTPPFPSVTVACFVDSIAFLTAKYWWYPARILNVLIPSLEKQMKFFIISSSRAFVNIPSKKVSN